MTTSTTRPRTFAVASHVVIILLSIIASSDAYSVNNPQQMVLTWERGIEQQIRSQIQDISHAAADGKNPDQPFMIAAVGIPGSGKSTSCTILSDLLEDEGCLLMPFDGYHHSVKTLQSFPNADDAIYRRGAPDTFDPAALIRDLERIRLGTERAVHVPGFDHATGDPEDNAHQFVRGKHNIVLCEGLYLLHDQDGWDEVRDYFDYSLFIDADIDTCMNRLKIRNTVIPGYTPEEIEFRVDAVDRVNAKTVARSKTRAHHVVQSAAAKLF